MDQIRAKDREDTKCQPCFRAGVHKKAAWWCCCGKVLCDKCSMEHEAFGAEHEMAQLSENPPKPVAENACTKHGREIPTMFCKKCDQVICQHCFLEAHTGCGQMLPLDVAASEKRTEKETHQEEIEAKIKDLQEIIGQMNGHKETVTRCKNRIEDQVRKGIKDIETVLRKHERNLLSDVEQLHAKQQELTDRVVQQCEEELRPLVSHARRLQKISDVTDDLDLLRVCKEGKHLLKQEPNLRDQFSPKTINFQPNLEFLFSVRKMKELPPGKVTVLDGKYDTGTETDSSEFTGDVLDRWMDRLSPKMVSEFLVDSDDRKMECDVDDVIVLFDGSVVVSEFEKNYVKVFTGQGDLVKVVSVEAPRGMCAWSDDEIAVTKKGGIGFVINTENCRLVSVETNTQYFGICIKDDDKTKMICSAPELEQPAVDVISSQGVIICRISHNNLGYGIFKDPWYLCNTGYGGFLVSDWGNKRLLCLDVTGKIDFILRGKGETRLVEPLGVAAGRRCGILLVDIGPDKKSRIYEVSATGKRLRTLLTSREENEAWKSISVNNNRHLAVTCGNKIKVFQVPHSL